MSSKNLILLFSISALGISLLAKEEVSAVFDKGEKDDLDKGVVYKEKKPDKNAKKKVDERKAHAVQYHIKNLKSSDPDERQCSCEFLGALGSPDSVGPLIDVLNPDRKEPDLILIAAHGALVKITGKNFGYKNYDEWSSWWVKNKEEFLRKAETGVDETSKLAAQSANTIGRELMRRGEYRSAQGQFLVAVSKNPEIPDYRNNLGLSLLEQGRYLDAMEHFKECIGLNPDLPQPYMNIGRTYSRMDKNIEAQSWYKQALDRDKENKVWDLRWMIGKEYMRRADWTLAYEYLDQARVMMEKANLHDPRVHNDLAITHFGLDQYHLSWKELMNVRTLGYEPNPGFLAKVRKALLDIGVDPEKEDKEARSNIRGEEPKDEDAVDADKAMPAETK